MANYLDNLPLEGKIAPITDASYGAGLVVVEVMMGAGATIVFDGIRQELIDKRLVVYKDEGIETYGYVRDTTNEDVVNEMIERIEKEVGVVDILVNNANIIKRIPICSMTATEFRQVIDADLNTPFIVFKVVTPSMTEKGHGKIINIRSMMSELGRETVSVYVVARGGLKMLVKDIVPEYGEYNIQCSGAGPGYIATPQTTLLYEIQPDGSGHLFDQFIVSKTPAGRWGEAEDLGGSIVFLTSDALSFVNGLVLYVGGGILAYISKQPK